MIGLAPALVPPWLSQQDDQDKRFAIRPFASAPPSSDAWCAVPPSLPASARLISPRLVTNGELGVTFIGHASFFLQIGGKSVMIDPNFARWLFVLKRLRRPGVRVADLPAIDLVLVSHAHFDHLHRPSLRAHGAKQSEGLRSCSCDHRSDACLRPDFRSRVLRNHRTRLVEEFASRKSVRSPTFLRGTGVRAF